MTDISEELIEKVSRAICEARGLDPDEQVKQVDRFGDLLNVEPHWKLLRPQAVTSIAAFRLLRSLES